MPENYIEKKSQQQRMRTMKVLGNFLRKENQMFDYWMNFFLYLKRKNTMNLDTSVYQLRYLDYPKSTVSYLHNVVFFLAYFVTVQHIFRESISDKEIEIRYFWQKEVTTIHDDFYKATV